MNWLLTPPHWPVVVVTACIAIGCGGLPAASNEPQRARDEEALTSNANLLISTLRELSVIATGNAPSTAELERTAARIRRGESTFDGYIRGLVDDPGFSRLVAPRLLLGEDNVEPYAYSIFVLKSTEPSEGGDVIYYRDEPCQADLAESVHPWWDLESEVKVCPDSHRPTTLIDSDSGLRCLRATRQQGQCGCGPNLAFCARDEDQVRRILTGLHEESTRTIAHFVGDDLPLAHVFTENATVRDRYAEHAYVRARISAGDLSEVPSYADWPEEGRLARRAESRPGQHAGILTAPQLAYMTDSTRDRMRILYRIAWCSNPTALGGDTNAILGLAEADLRSRAHTSSAWQQLAAQPGCTDCHARLDYGMQFFHEYPGIADGYGPIAELRPEGSGPLYGRDIDDRRGDAELNPAGFAELLVRQPEYVDCVTRSLAEYVLGREVRPTHIDALAQLFRQNGRLKPAMRMALRHWVDARGERVLRERSRPAARSSHLATTSVDLDARTVAGEGVVLTADLRGDLIRHCGTCHSESSEERVDLTQTAVDRDVLRDALNRVAFYTMPPGVRGMESGDRGSLVRGLVQASFAAEDRTLAEHYYGGGPLSLSGGSPTQRHAGD